MATTIERPNFRERCRREATSSVIFLLQSRYWIYTGSPGPEYDHCDEGGYYRPLEDGDDGEEGRSCLTGEEMSEMTNSDGYSCAIQAWRDEGVWLSREEATAFAERTHYRYPDGWRVYGHVAHGELADLLKTT